MILQLPDEILCLISRQLDNQHDRLQMATSCRQLYGTLRSTIFWKVMLCNYRPENREIKQVSQFLYTLVREPKLARMVQELELDGWDTAATCEFHGYPTKVDYDSDVMEPLVREASGDSDRQKSWISDLERGITDAWLALLIPKLSNLRKISLTWNFEADYVSKMFVEAAKAETPVFSHLEEAYAAHWDTEGGADTELMLPFFKFPAMRKIGGFRLCDGFEWDENGNAENSLRHIEIGCSSVTDIDLDITNATDGLQSWIRSCKALKSFRIRDGGSNISYEPPNQRRLYEALLLHKTTLQAVSISDDLDPDENENSFMGTFADFTNLKTLHVPCTGIVERDDEDMPTQGLIEALPSSLELLFLYAPYGALLEWVIEQCDLLLDSNVCSNLKTICIESSSFSKAEISPKIEELERRCQDGNVSMRTFKSESLEAATFWDSIWPVDHIFVRL